MFSIDEDALKSELKVAKRCILNIDKSENLDVKMRAQVLKSVVQKEAFPNVYLLLHTALSIPISSATCERSFSCMRRIKTYIRSTMIQDRFTDLAILNIERDLSNKINKDNILKIFKIQGSRRIHL